MADSIIKTFLFINTIFILIYIGLLIYGTTIKDEHGRIGMIVAFSVSIAHCLFFYLFMLASWLFSNRVFDSDFRRKVTIGAIISGLIYILGTIAVVIAGAPQKNTNLRLGLIVGGGVALFHSILFAAIIIILLGLSVARR